MKKSMICAFMAAFVLLGVALVGCGGGSGRPADLPKLVKASFTVTQEGQPVADAYVNLRGGDGRWAIFGRSDAKGKVVLSTYKEEFVGAPAGEYAVTVEKIERTPSEVPPLPKDATMKDLIAYDNARAQEYRPSFYLVNPDYMNFDTSDLTVTIGADGTCTPDPIDVGPAIREEFDEQADQPSELRDENEVD